MSNFPKELSTSSRIIIMLVILITQQFLIRFTLANTISTVVGTGIGGNLGDGGQAILARILGPQGFAFSQTGIMYICDSDNDSIRKVTTDGTISLFVAKSAGSDDPDGAVVDKDGNFYFADKDYHRIRKVTPGGVITIYAGGNGAGFLGDDQLATTAKLTSPTGLTMDQSGNLYIADDGNKRIRVVNFNTQIISTYAGTGVSGFSGDGGPATSAQMSTINQIYITPSNELYMVDGNRVRKISSSGTISTIAGTGVAGFSGDGGLATSAQLNAPNGLVLSINDGLVYIADSNNHRIRVINSNGIILTVAGTGVAGYSGDGGLATSAQLNFPYNMANGLNGDLYFSEKNNNIIRKMTVTIMRTCFGIYSFNSSVCSSHGSCIGPDLCKCDTYWYGNQCQNSIGLLNIYTDNLPKFLQKNVNYEMDALVLQGNFSDEYLINPNFINAQIVYTWNIVDEFAKVLASESGVVFGTLENGMVNFSPKINIRGTLTPSSNLNVTMELSSSVFKRVYSVNPIDIVSPVVAPTQLVNISKTQGEALVDLFQVICNPWTASPVLEPLQYAIGFYDTHSKQAIRSTDFSTNTSLSTVLPYLGDAVQIVVFVKDSLGNIVNGRSTFVLITEFTGTLESLLSIIQTLSKAQLAVAAYDRSKLTLSSPSLLEIIKNTDIDIESPSLGLLILLTASRNPNVNDPVNLLELSSKINSMLETFVERFQNVTLQNNATTRIDNNSLKLTLSIISNIFTFNKTTPEQTIDNFVSVLSKSMTPRVLTNRFSDLTSSSIISENINVTSSNFIYETETILQGQIIGDGLNTAKMKVMEMVTRFGKTGVPSVVSMVTYSKNSNGTMLNSSLTSIHDFSFSQQDVRVPLLDLEQPIYLTFNTRPELIQSNNSVILCKYWNETTFSWRTNGCTLSNLDKERGVIECACNHTTMFSTFIEYNQQANLVSEVYGAEIFFGVIFAIISLILIVLLAVFYKRSPIASRLGTPFLGLIALLVEAILASIIQRSVLISQSSTYSQSGTDGANVVGNIVTIVSNTLNLTAIMSFMFQVFRFQLLKYLYQLLTTLKTEKTSDWLLKALRYSTSTTCYIIVVVCFAISQLILWSILVILVRTDAISNVSYTMAVSIIYAIISLAFSVVIILIAVFDFVFSIRSERQQDSVNAKRNSKRLSIMSLKEITNREFKKPKDLFIPFKKAYNMFVFLDGPLYFRIEMLLYVIYFIFLFCNQVIGLESLQYKFDPSKKAMTIRFENANFIIELFARIVYLFVFGGYALLVFAFYTYNNHKRIGVNKKEIKDMQHVEVQAVLEDEIGLSLLETFCEKEFSSENIMMFLDLKSSPKIVSGEDIGNLPQFMLYLFDIYLKTGGVAEVNIPSKCRNQFMSLFKKVIMENQDFFKENQSQLLKEIEQSYTNEITEVNKETIVLCFDNIEQQVLSNLLDTFSRFVFTLEYKTYVKAKKMQKELATQANMTFQQNM